MSPENAMIVPETEHSATGPSSLWAIAQCPGKVNQCAALPLAEPKERDADSDAEKGRMRHHLAAEGLMNPGKREELFSLLPEEDHALVRSWWTFLEEQYAAMQTMFPGEEIIVLVEYRVDMEDGRFGTLDTALVVYGKYALVPDLKNHMRERARYSLQVADYAGAVKALYGCETVAVAIVHRYGIDQWTYKPGELDERLRSIKRIVQAAQEPTAELRPGAQCQYCKANIVCPARSAIAAQVSALADPVATIKAMEPGQKRELYDNVKRAIDKLEAVKDQFNELILAGELEVPGYVAGKGKQSRTWLNQNEALIALTQLAGVAGLDPDKLTELISPPQAEKLFPKAKETIKGLCIFKDGKPSVVKAKGE